MNRKIILSLVLMTIWISASVFSYFFSTYIVAIVTVLAVGFATIVSMYYIWRPQSKDEPSPIKLGTVAISAVITLSSGPIWGKLLKSYSPSLEAMGVIPQNIGDYTHDFLAISMAGLLSVVAIVIIVLRDQTVTGQRKGNIDDEIQELGFKEKLNRIASVLDTRLNRLDDETNWTDQAFNPLDAEIEKHVVGRGKIRKLGDLISSIRQDRKAKSFLVLGDPGSGKSVAMRHLVHQMLTEVPRTSVLPIYVNLKEWADSDQILNNSGTADIWSFVTKSFVSGANDLQIDFCNKYLRKMLEIGSLFIVFDSFDEVPAILDHPDTSDILRNISSVFDDFIAGPHNSRCIIASRYFRRPRLFAMHIAMLEILPFSPKKIRENLNKSSRLSLSEIDSFIASRSHWLDASKNPFVAQLVIDYISANRGKIPFSKIEVYDAYIRTRLNRLEDILTEYKMTTDSVIEVATQISFAMFSHTRVGLEASLDEILQWLKTYSAQHIRNVADILVRSRLMRKGPFPAERLSFVHRRFNEYFLAKAAADGLMAIDLESIATDRRDRDALVLYVELAESEQVQRIIAFCWQQLSVTASEDAHATAEHIIEDRLIPKLSKRDSDGEIPESACV